MATVTAAMVKALRDQTGAGMLACKHALEQSEGDLEKAKDVLRARSQGQAAKKMSRVAAEGMVMACVSADRKTGFILEINSETDFLARDEQFKAFAQTVLQRGLSKEVKTRDDLLALPIEESGERTIEQARYALIANTGENITIRRAQLMVASSGMLGVYCHGQRIAVLVEIDRDEPDLGKELAMHIAAMRPEVVHSDQLPVEQVNKEKVVLLAQTASESKPPHIIEKMVQGRLQKWFNEITLIGQPFFKDTHITVKNWLDLKQIKVFAFIRYEVGEGIEKQQQDFAHEVAEQLKKVE